MNPTPKVVRRREAATAVLGPLLVLMGCALLVWAGCFWVVYALLG